MAPCFNFSWAWEGNYKINDQPVHEWVIPSYNNISEKTRGEQKLYKQTFFRVNN